METLTFQSTHRLDVTEHRIVLETVVGTTVSKTLYKEVFILEKPTFQSTLICARLDVTEHRLELTDSL